MNILEDCVRSLQTRPSPNVIKCLLKYDLISFLKEKRHSQDDILKVLGNTGIQSLFEWIYSKDIELRKAASLLLCELAHDNNKAQERICQAMQYSFMKGKIALNRLPKRIEALLKERPDLLKLLKKEEQDNLKYWAFPPLDSLTYKSSLDNLFFFPDPLDYVIGFNIIKKDTKNFINTTTSYFSEDFDVSDTLEEIKDRKGTSPMPSSRKKEMESLKEPVIYSPKLYSYGNDEMLGPVEVESPHQKSRSSVSPTKPTRSTLDSIEASINRIKGALNQLSRPNTTRTHSPINSILSLTSRPKEKIKSPEPLPLSSKRKQLTTKLQGIIKNTFHSPLRKLN